MKPIARMKSDFPTKFGIPRQSGLVPSLQSTIILEPEFRVEEALRGLDEFSHIWIIWEFSQAKQKKWTPTVRPPRLGGNVRKGVFATRSPFRPNSLGLSCVKLEYIEWNTKEGPVIHVSGADLLDGTPIYDIKPYLPYVDSHPEATGGFAHAHKDERLEVKISEEWKKAIGEKYLKALTEVLAQDPRPAYQDDPERVYGFPFGDLEVKFKVKGSVLEVCQVFKF